MKIIPEAGSWFYKSGDRSFQIGVGWHYSPTNGWKVRASFGFWFVGLIFSADELAPYIRRGQNLL